MPTIDPVAEFFWRAGTFLILTAWLLGSGWFVFAVSRDIYAQWGTWHTYPIPDKRAMKHLVGVLVVIGVNLLFTWFGLWWFL